MKKSGLGKDPLSWISSTIKEEEEGKIKEIQEDKEKVEIKGIPKFKTFEIRLTTLLREDQLEFLEKLIRDIHKNRSPQFRKERITKNTLIRVFIDAFQNVNFNIKDIPDEKELLKRVLEKVVRD
ncbi:MAG: hypothetical protein NC827_00015 [Candidatus Omnitrophica bacterium]|nr:hypothetical protein [Candidatus Omnitrophota bacterium]MCM8801689.1 hypothetical protein [Candidatus Omnitrophota bacterium]